MTGSIMPHSPPLDDEGLAASTFSTRPGDTATVIFGTRGENDRGTASSSSGIYRGIQGSNGWIWTQVLATAQSGNVFKIRWADANTVHAATSTGYWISRNAGVAGSWTIAQGLGGSFSDLAILPNNPNVVYLANLGVGLQKVTWSNNGGQWSPTAQTSVPILSFQNPPPPICTARIAVSAANPSLVWYMASDENCNSFFLYTAKVGVPNDTPAQIPNCQNGNLTGCFPSSAIGGGSGAVEVGAISVNPTNANIMLIGVGGAYVTLNATSTLSWTKVSDVDLHADIRTFGWSQSVALAGTDGGFFTSSLSGNLVNWQSNTNVFPMVSAMDFDLIPSSGFLMGTSWDTHGFVTSNFKAAAGVVFNSPNFDSSQGPCPGIGDFVNVTADPGSADSFWATDDCGGCEYTADGANSFKACNLPGGTPPWQVQTDRVPPVYIYAWSGNSIYQSTNNGLNWNPIVNVPEGAAPNSSPTLGVGTWNGSIGSGGSILYAAGPTKLWFRATGSSMIDVTPSKATGTIQGVATHPGRDYTSANTAWAWKRSLPEQIFVTTGGGLFDSWTDITDNFPQQSLTIADVVPDPASGSPPSILYAATVAGVYKYDNSGVAGAKWRRWTANMPAAGSQSVNRLRTWDQRPNGPFMVYADLYGGGIWSRNGAEDATWQLANSSACVTSVANRWALGCGGGGPGQNGVFWWDGYGWNQIPGAGGNQITTDENGTPWVVNFIGNVYYWNGQSFVRFSNPGLNLVAVVVGDPSLPNEIWAIDKSGDIWVNHGTQFAPGAWGGGPGDKSWGPSVTNDPAGGIAVFTATGSGCGKHVPFYVGNSQNVYQFTGGSCSASPGWSLAPGARAANKGVNLIGSISTNVVVGNDGNLWQYNPQSPTKFSLLAFFSGNAAVGVGSDGLGVFAFDNSGLPYWLSL